MQTQVNRNVEFALFCTLLTACEYFVWKDINDFDKSGPWYLMDFAIFGALFLSLTKGELFFQGSLFSDYNFFAIDICINWLNQNQVLLFMENSDFVVTWCIF